MSLPVPTLAPGSSPRLPSSQQFFVPAPPRGGVPPSGLPIVSPPQLGGGGSWVENGGKAAHLQAATLFVGVVAVLCVILPPLSIGVLMLWDPSYTFWLGRSYPLGLVLASLGTLVLFVAVCALLQARGARDELDERAFAWTAAAFAGLLGACLVLLAVPGSRGLHLAAEDLSQGRGSTLAEAAILMDFMKVLYNIRSTRACLPAGVASVEDCTGWAENKYTAYLRDLETEFQCGPLHGQPFDTTPPASGEVLLQVAAGSGGERHERTRRLGRRRGASHMSLGAGLAPRPPHHNGSTDQDVGGMATAAVGGDSGYEGVPFRVGDSVMISQDRTKVQDAFRVLPRYEWADLMPDMLGKHYQVLSTTTNPDIMVGVLSPDGSQNGVWYFPAWILKRAQLSSLASSPKLFSKGTNDLTCFPLVATRLQSYAWAFGDLLFWQGLCLIIVSLLIVAAPVLAMALCGPTGGPRGGVDFKAGPCGDD